MTTAAAGTVYQFAAALAEYGGGQVLGVSAEPCAGGFEAEVSVLNRQRERLLWRYTITLADLEAFKAGSPIEWLNDWMRDRRLAEFEANRR